MQVVNCFLHCCGRRLFPQRPIRSNSDMYYVPNWKRDTPNFESHTPRVLIAPLVQTSRLLFRRGQAEKVYTIFVITYFCNVCARGILSQIA
jgi:hypothetical protein